MLPRIPLVSDYEKFWAFSKAGRKLANLHLNYENVAPMSDVIVDSLPYVQLEIQNRAVTERSRSDGLLAVAEGGFDYAQPPVSEQSQSNDYVCRRWTL